MDVVNAEQARIAEESGACAVMALERVPADIRKDGGVARMSDPKMIKEICRCCHHSCYGQGPHRPLCRSPSMYYYFYCYLKSHRSRKGR